MAKTFLNTMFIAVSVLSAVVSLGLVGVGVWYSLLLQEVTSLRPLNKPINVDWTQVIPSVFVGVGILGFLIVFCGFFGICGSKACLKTYNVCAVIVILAMLGAAFAAIVVAIKNNDEFIKNSFGEVFKVINYNYDVREKFSKIESRYVCCGADGDINYEHGKRPESCCDKGIDCNLSTTRREGCIKVFNEYSKYAFYAGTAGCSAIAILAFASVCFSMLLIRSTTGKKGKGDDI